MSCATSAQLAAGEVDASHIACCLACRRALEEQRAITSQLAALDAPALGANRRRTLAAEVMARADLHDDTHELGASRARVVHVLAGTIAIAASAAVLAFLGGGDERALSARIESSASSALVETAATVATTPPPPAPPPAAPRRPAPPAEDIGEPALDPAPAPAPAPTTLPRKLDRTRQLFGGTTGKVAPPIEREMLVEETPIAAFRAGWEALRAQRYDDAIAAFDRATDPAVLEDAVFWAAIAAQRAGHRTDARKRLDLFLASFPESPRVESARRAREVLR